MAIEKLRKPAKKLTPAEIARERARAESAWRAAKTRKLKRKKEVKS